MSNCRTYGPAPFKVALIHGGPGAAGEMAPVARELASGRGVLEPLQTAGSITGQIEELRTVLRTTGDLPITLTGFSWGAWLSFIFAAHYPDKVQNLILIGSGPFEANYANAILETRFSRLNGEERAEAQELMAVLEGSALKEQGVAFARLGALFSKADAYDPFQSEADLIDARVEIFRSVWPEASQLRSSGRLLELGQRIQCPVVAIQGDYDPHPVAGVQKPLSSVLNHFRFIVLKNCGHKPWIERQAKDEFYSILETELLPAK